MIPKPCTTNCSIANLRSHGTGAAKPYNANGQSMLQVAGAWKWGVVVHVISWYLQLHPGHMIFEGRKPALVEGLVQAFATAPLFVWMEVLFACGYWKALQREIGVLREEGKQN